jgi:hypothetical protein
LPRLAACNPHLTGKVRKTYLSEIWLESYQEARLQAADETESAIATFPEQCPYTIENILNTDYLP